MTLEECKDQVAKIHYFNTWNEIDWYFMNERNGITEPPYMEERLQVEAAELYAQSQVNEALDEVDKVLDKVLSSTAKSLVIEELKRLKR